jgi:DNA-binding SARP family transcriptional activator
MLSLALLGPFQAHVDKRPLTQFHTTKAQALLIYLAVEPQRMHQREGLMTLLWPDLPLKSAQQSLRQTLYRLRKVIEPDTAANPIILADRLTIGWNPDAPPLLDVAQFEALSSPVRSPEEWRQAANLYRGEFLADIYVTDSEAYESWALNRRAVYTRAAHELLQRLAAHYLAQGSYAEAETAVRRNLELDYFQEAAHRQLLTALS